MANRSRSTDFEAFNRALDTILKADPKAVKAAMAEDKRNREVTRSERRSETRHSGRSVAGSRGSKGGSGITEG
jgi:hypothetical protein